MRVIKRASDASRAECALEISVSHNYNSQKSMGFILRPLYPQPIKQFLVIGVCPLSLTFMLVFAQQLHAIVGPPPDSCSRRTTSGILVYPHRSGLTHQKRQGRPRGTAQDVSLFSFHIFALKYYLHLAFALVVTRQGITSRSGLPPLYMLLTPDSSYVTQRAVSESALLT